MQFKPKELPAVVGCDVVVSVIIHCALLHSVWNLKATKKVQRILNRENML